ncbi:MAG: hypothetical protein COV65_04435 [Nitrosopumilales archaeon CG11_big_fil_rev_8_21_14_0_20_33_24]|nr:MAG: hypothetical protein COV65_04435 [Nitrosopumilales archaeon CG11_big_fil_rev_8_21_14_0_20_33_24]
MFKICIIIWIKLFEIEDLTFYDRTAQSWPSTKQYCLTLKNFGMKEVLRNPASNRKVIICFGVITA